MHPLGLRDRAHVRNLIEGLPVCKELQACAPKVSGTKANLSGLQMVMIPAKLNAFEKIQEITQFLHIHKLGEKVLLNPTSSG